MAHYKFVTVWRLSAPIASVWRVLVDTESWPRWWPGVEQVTALEPGDEDGVGALWHYVWKSRLPYRLAFQMRTTRVERPRLLEGVAEGELAGTGRWELSEAEGSTAVRYLWQVRTTRAWMNLLTPIARPLFAWNHDIVMRQGGEGLARLLQARLLSHA